MSHIFIPWIHWLHEFLTTWCSWISANEWGKEAGGVSWCWHHRRVDGVNFPWGLAQLVQHRYPWYIPRLIYTSLLFYSSDKQPLYRLTALFIINHYTNLWITIAVSITLVIAVVMAASLFLYVSDNILITISLVPSSSVLPHQSPGTTRNHTPSAVGLVWHPDPGKHGTVHPYHHNSGLVWRGSNVYSLSTHRGTQAISWSSTEAPTVLIAFSSTSQSRTSVIVEATHLVRVLAGARVVTSTVRDGQGVSPTIWRHAHNVRNTNLYRRPRVCQQHFFLSKTSNRNAGFFPTNPSTSEFPDWQVSVMLSKPQPPLLPSAPSLLTWEIGAKNPPSSLKRSLAFASILDLAQNVAERYKKDGKRIKWNDSCEIIPRISWLAMTNLGLLVCLGHWDVRICGTFHPHPRRSDLNRNSINSSCLWRWGSMQHHFQCTVNIYLCLLRFYVVRFTPKKKTQKKGMQKKWYNEHPPYHILL